MHPFVQNQCSSTEESLEKKYLKNCENLWAASDKKHHAKSDLGPGGHSQILVFCGHEVHGIIQSVVPSDGQWNDKALRTGATGGNPYQIYLRVVIEEKC